MRQPGTLRSERTVPGFVRTVRANDRRGGRSRPQVAGTGWWPERRKWGRKVTDRLAELSATGVAIWLDDLSRDQLVSGRLDQLRREQHVVGITSNPTIFAKAVADSKEYEWQLRDLAVRGVSLDEAARMLTTYDIRWACDVMRPAYDTSGGVDGRVSLEVDPRLAYDTERTIAEAKALWWLV